MLTLLLTIEKFWWIYLNLKSSLICCDFFADDKADFPDAYRFFFHFLKNQRRVNGFEYQLIA